MWAWKATCEVGSAVGSCGWRWAESAAESRQKGGGGGFWGGTGKGNGAGEGYACE